MTRSEMRVACGGSIEFGPCASAGGESAGEAEAGVAVPRRAAAHRVRRWPRSRALRMRTAAGRRLGARTRSQVAADLAARPAGDVTVLRVRASALTAVAKGRAVRARPATARPGTRPRIRRARETRSAAGAGLRAGPTGDAACPVSARKRHSHVGHCDAREVAARRAPWCCLRPSATAPWRLHVPALTPAVGRTPTCTCSCSRYPLIVSTWTRPRYANVVSTWTRSHAPRYYLRERSDTPS